MSTIKGLHNEIHTIVNNNPLIEFILPKDTILYRSGQNQELQETPTFFSRQQKTAKIYQRIYNDIYMKDKKKRDYKVKKDVTLLNISNVKTINSLLNISFHTHKNFYNIVKKMFISQPIEDAYNLFKHDVSMSGINELWNFDNYSGFFTKFETDTQPWQVCTPIRNSEKDNDFKFVTELCKLSHYQGYIADEMRNVHGSVVLEDKNFHEEIMLCNPKEVLEIQHNFNFYHLLLRIIHKKV
jgi:hypothetical protein